MTTRDVAEMLGVTEWTVRAWCRRNTGPPFYRIGRSVRYDRAEVLAWRAARRQPGS
jgi:excisionase family DNA binding protein